MPVTSVSRPVAAPVHDIWNALSDIPNARRWNPSWEKIEFSSNQTHGAGTRFKAYVDGRPFEFEIGDWVVPEFISFTPIREQGERYAIMLESQAFRLTAIDDDLTSVEIIAHASTHGFRGILMGIFFWAGHQRQGLNHALDNVEALFAPASDEDEDLEEIDEWEPESERVVE